jgi:hypothetical protein
MAAIDLTTLTQIQAQATVQTGETGLVAAMITAISRHILTRTGRRVLAGTQTFTADLYDGSGGDKQFLRDWPAQSVTNVSVFGQTVNASPDGVNPGWVLDTYGASLALLPGTAIGGPISYSAWLIPLGRFPHGRLNVSVSYTAGYVATGGPGPHPPSDPVFNGAPSELGQAVTEFVVQMYKRRDWVDQKSKTISNVGETITFRDWEIPPWLQVVIQNYKRTWLV